MTDYKTPGGRLTEAGVREIRRRREIGETYQAIATALSLTVTTVFNVCSGRTWGWLR